LSVNRRDDVDGVSFISAHPAPARTYECQRKRNKTTKRRFSSKSKNQQQFENSTVTFNTMKTISIFFVLTSLSAVSAFAPVAPTASAIGTKAALSPTALDLFGFGKKEEADVAVAEKEPVLETVVDKDIETFMEGDNPEEKENMMQQIKSAGKAGALSLFLWELAFWAISLPVAIFGFEQVNGAWPDFGNQDDLAKVGAEAFAFANVARLALPVRIGLAVATIGWVDENIVQADWAPEFLKNEKSEEE
jgi:hypothetical protein